MPVDPKTWRSLLHHGHPHHGPPKPFLTSLVGGKIICTGWDVSHVDLRRRFDSIQLIPASSGFDHTTAQKDTAHFPRIQKETGIEYSKMLFFDDEVQNIQKVDNTYPWQRRAADCRLLSWEWHLCWLTHRQESVSKHSMMELSFSRNKLQRVKTWDWRVAFKCQGTIWEF